MKGFLRTARMELAVLGLAIVMAPGCISLAGADLSDFSDREERRFSVAASPEVGLSTFDGSIDVRTWDNPEVLVVIEKRAASKRDLDEIDVHVEQTGNRISIDVKAPRDHHVMGFLHSRSARLTVSVPVSASVSAASGDGAIDVAGTNGHLDLTTGDGSIRGQGLTGDIRARTGDGAIRLDSVNGSLDLHTGDGSVRVSGAVGSLRAQSGDGSVTIRAEAGAPASGDWDITTGDGAVTLELPDVFDADLDAHTGDGRIRLLDVALSGDNTDRARRRQTVTGRLGAGGRRLRVRTGDGPITIQRR